MPTKKLTPTTKTIDELAELFEDGRLDLTPDFQRNSVWPGPAKAYLVDTILQDMPIPLIFLTRERDTNANRLTYRVIDGQQRIRTAISFLKNRFTITNEFDIRRKNGTKLQRVRYRHLPDNLKEQFIGYSFVVTELSGYSEDELRDIFVRINKYVVKLNPQELRDAETSGPFREFVDDCAADPVWNDLGLFTQSRRNRKRDKEFIAELAVLYLDGPQDKKGSLDLYYAATRSQFARAGLRDALIETAILAGQIIDDAALKPFRRLPAFYGLMGALFQITSDEDTADRVRDSTGPAQDALIELQEEAERLPTVINPEDVEPDSTKATDLARAAFLLRRSLSRQTDNIRPRIDRIEVLEKTILGALET